MQFVKLFLISSCILLTQIAGQATSSCLDKTPVYGTVPNGAILVSDMSYLRSQNFNTSMIVSKIIVCGS